MGSEENPASRSVQLRCYTLRICKLLTDNVYNISGDKVSTQTASAHIFRLLFLRATLLPMSGGTLKRYLYRIVLCV